MRTGPAEVSDLYPVTYIAPALYVTHELLHRTIFPVLSEWIVAHDRASPPAVRERNRAKVVAASWSLFSHGTMLGLAVWTMWSLEWPTVGRHLFEHFETHGLEPGILFLHQYSLAMYMVDFFFLFSKPKQKDFWQMVFHHICTIILLLGSLYTGYYRAGSVIMFLHDLTDPIMEAAKLSLYAGNTRMADLLFGGFAVMFLIVRGVIFPWHCIRTGYVFGHAWARPVLFRFLCLLKALYVLHLYWSSIILRMVVAAFRDGSVKGDARDITPEPESAAAAAATDRKPARKTKKP